MRMPPGRLAFLIITLSALVLLGGCLGGELSFLEEDAEESLPDEEEEANIRTLEAQAEIVASAEIAYCMDLAASCAVTFWGDFQYRRIAFQLDSDATVQAGAVWEPRTPTSESLQLSIYNETSAREGVHLEEQSGESPIAFEAHLPAGSYYLSVSPDPGQTATVVLDQPVTYHLTGPVSRG